MCIEGICSRLSIDALDQHPDGHSVNILIIIIIIIIIITIIIIIIIMIIIIININFLLRKFHVNIIKCA